MKKALVLVATLIIITSAFAFDKGTMNLGGTASLSISKVDSDDDSTTELAVRPQFGYFVADNICIDGILIYESQSGDNDVSAFGIGIGGRYFYNRFYGGLDFQYQSVTRDVYNDGSLGVVEWTSTGMFLQPKVGVLLPVSENVYVDLGASYQLGIGEWGSDGSGNNEFSDMQFNIGLQYFFTR
jgi:hypothetical protein